MLQYMLDTNIAIYVIKRRPIEALTIFNAQAGVLVPSPMPNYYMASKKANTPQKT